MKIAGIILIIIGLIDAVGSWVGFDFWGGFIGIELPEIIWQFTGYLEIGAGYFLYNLDQGAEEDDTETETETN